MVDDRVVVVGGGVAGLSCARALAPDHDVTVFDAGAVAGDTTSRASGMITLPLEPLSPAVREHAAEFFRSFDGTGVFDFTARPTARLVPAGDADAARREATADGATFLSVDALRERHPDAYGDLSDYAGALLYADTGHVEPVEYAITLKREAERDGAAVYRDHRVEGLRVADGRVTGVETEYCTVDADHVVYAAGWRTRGLLADHVALPVRPLRWNAVVLRPEPPLAGSLPMGSEPTMQVYWRPTAAGDVLVGGNEHLLDDPASAPVAVDEAFRDTVREGVAPLLRGLDGARVVREDCCPGADTATPDGLPIVDAPAAAPDGLVVATGFHGRGVMLSPVTATAVRSLVTGEGAPFALDGFAVDRFDDRGTDFAYVSHWES